MEIIENKEVGEPILPPSKSDKVIDKLNKLASGQLTSGKVTDAVDTKLYNTDLGASQYDKGIIIEQHLDTEDFVQSLQEFRARKQPVSDQIANAVVNVAGDLTLGTLGQIGSALDFGDYFNSDQELGNWLTNLTNAGQDSLKSNFKNYHKKPGEHFAMGDSAWWIDTVGSLVGSVGSFALSGGVLAKGLMGLSKLARATKLANAMGKVAGKGNMAKLYSKTGGHAGAEAREQVFGTVTNAVMLNQAEGMMEATDVMEATFAFQMQKEGMTEEEAQKIAVRAGVTTLNTNRFNIALNLTSANLFLKSAKYSDSMMGVKAISKKASLGRGALEGSQESLEELINMWSGSKGIAYGKGEDYSFIDVLDDLNSLEALEAATLGFVGGMGQTVATAEGVNRFMMMGDPENEGQKISIRDYNKRTYAKSKEYIAELDKAYKASDIGTVTDAFKNQVDRLKLVHAIRDAENNDDSAKAEQLKQMLLTFQAEEAFDKGVASHLVKIYEDMGNGPQQEGMDDNYKQKAQEAVQKIKKLQKLYDNNAALEAGKYLYRNRATRSDATDAIEGTKLEMAELHAELSKEIERLTDGTDIIIDPNFKSIPKDATKEELAIYEQIRQSDPYGRIKGLEGDIVDMNKHIKSLDDQYKVLKSPDFQEKVKKQREANEAGAVTKKEEEEIEKQSDEAEAEAELIREKKAEEAKAKEEEEAIKAAEAAEKEAEEETETEFDKAVRNYSVGEQIPITSKLVDGLNSDEEHGGTIIEIDEEAGTMLVELEDGTIVTVHRNRKVEFAKPEVHTIPEIDHSTEGGQEGKVAEPAPDSKNTTTTEQEGGAKIISRMDDGSALLNQKGLAWMEEQFAAYLEYERIPMSKKGKRVGFEINQPFTDNQRRAINVYNKKVKRKHKDPITEDELRDLYYHLPILANFGGDVKAPIENETREENRREGDKSVENFENFTLPLRKGIIDALIAGKDINKIYTRVQDQYKGILKVAPKTADNKVAENNVMELDFISGDFSKVDIRVVNDDNDLEDKHGETEPGGMAGKGEIYLMIQQANGEPYRLKLNVRRMNESEAEILYQLYKLRLLNQEVNKGTRLSRLPAVERKIIMDLAAPAIKVMVAAGRSKNDLTVKDLTDFYVWDLTSNEKSRILMDKEGFKFGETVIHGKTIADHKEEFKTWLKENKRHHVKFKSKKNDTVKLNARVDNYIKYLIETGVINTNAVVNEPTFQKRTHIYLESKARVEGEEQVTPEKKTKERIEKSTMSKKGMSREEATIAVHEEFRARIMEKKRSLISSGTKRRLASKAAEDFYKDEIAEATERMMGVTSEPAPVTKAKIVPTKKKVESMLTPEEQQATLREFIETKKVITDFSPAQQKYLNDVSLKERLEMADKIQKEQREAVRKQTPVTKKKPLTKAQQKYYDQLKAQYDFEGEDAKERRADLINLMGSLTNSPKDKAIQAAAMKLLRDIAEPSTDVKGEAQVEEEKVDPTHPEIKELTNKLKETLSTIEMANNAGAFPSQEEYEKEKQEANDKYTEDVKNIAKKIRNIKENIVSLEDEKKRERMEKLAARRAARNNPDDTPPKKQC